MSFRLSRKKKILAGFLILVTTSACFFFTYSQEIKNWTFLRFHVHGEFKKQQDRIEAAIPKFRLHRVLFEKQAYWTVGSEQNAESFLEKGYRWTKTDPLPRYLQDLPKTIQEKLSSENWARESYPPLPVELSFLKTLRAFDHWDLDDMPRVQEFVREVLSQPSLEIDSLPEPYFDDLVLLAKLRWVQAFRRGDFQNALEETRHLGSLVLSTERLGGLISAHAILRVESEAGIKIGQRAISWNTPDAMMAKGGLLPYMLAFESIFSPLARARVVKEFGNSTWPGHCTLLGSAVIVPAILRPLLTPSILGSPDFRPAYTQMDAVMSSSPCRLKTQRKIWKAVLNWKYTGETVLRSLESEMIGAANIDPDKPIPKVLAKVVGMTLLTIAPGISHYE